VNKPELVSSIAEKTGMKKKDAEAMLDAFVASVKGALKKGEKVALIGFGTFATRERAKRNGVNPRTGKKITIPAKTVPYFKVGKELKESVK
jgi:DNA-binding protein HU-beta